MNNLREALEEISRQVVDELNCAEGDRQPVIMLEIVDQIAIKALEAADKWRAPDETTPDSAMCWAFVSGDSWIGDQWVCTSWLDIKTDSFYEEALFMIDEGNVVLAKENQGPPQDDWRPTGQGGKL